MSEQIVADGYTLTEGLDSYGFPWVRSNRPGGGALIGVADQPTGRDWTVYVYAAHGPESLARFRDRDSAVEWLTYLSELIVKAERVAA